MAEVLVEFTTLLAGQAGDRYTPRVCGRALADGMWEGWIEFSPEDGGEVLRTPRETLQPNRRDLEYWATGLTTSYLEGALARALTPQPIVHPPRVPVRPAFAGPADAPDRDGRLPPPHRPVLDPFHVFAQGEKVLREELDALAPDHLLSIVRAYMFAPEFELEAHADDPLWLRERILAGARAGMT